METKIIIKNTTGSTMPTLSYGELGICYKNGVEKLFAKNSTNEIFAFNDWNKIFNRPTSFDGYGITGGTISGGITGVTATFTDLVNMKNGAVIESIVSGSTVLDVQGTFGQLFSVTDNLIGDIFKVSDVSGMPILNVNSDGLVSIYDNLFIGSGITSSILNVTSLTSNYLPKHTSDGFTNSLIYDSGSGVGLGTTSIGNWKMVLQSNYPLQIKNSNSLPVFEFYADLKENRYLNGLSILGYLQDLVINTSPSYDLLLQPTGGTVGIGTSNPSASYKLDVNGSVKVGNSTTNGLTITNGSQSVTLTVDSNGVLKLDNSSSGASFYATGEISAYGAGTGSTGGGGGSSYNRLDLWSDYSVDKSGYVLSAYLGNDLNSRLSAIEGNGATSITTIGAGNAITSVSKTGNLITFNKDITFLTQNQNITLSGDVAGSGNTGITTSIAASTVTSKVLTGYTVGTNAAVAATDSILSAFGKIQAQINARPGTVTSIGITVPTGLQVTPSTITSAGTFAISFASGYSIPTTSNQSNWDIAYSSVTGATSSNTANTIIKRDASGNFVAGTITATLTGNASSATKLQTSRTIWGQSFDGTGNVSGAITNASTGDFSGTVKASMFEGKYYVLDTRGNVELPSAITSNSVNFVFKFNNIVDDPPVSNGSTYAHIMNMNGWNGGNNGGGGHNSQLAFGDGLAIRISSSTSSWGVWRKFWHDGNSNLTSIPWSASTLTLNGSLVGATSGVFSSTLNVSGATNIASTLTTSGLITGNNGISSTYLNLTNNLTITCGNSDRYITFNYASSNTYDWRIGYLGSGAADANYLVFQSNKESGGTYFNALRFGLNTLDATFGGNILPETNNTKTLGSPSYTWNNVYSRYLSVYSESSFAGIINANGGIKISNGTQSVTLTVDSNGVLKLDNASSGASFYATGEVSAYGLGQTGGTGGGSSYNRLDLWGDYSVDKAGYVLSAYLGNDLNSRLSAIEGNGATSIVVNGTGDAVTSVSKTGNLITFTKGSTFAPSIGSTSIVNLGVVTAGTWSATDVGLAHGGTNASLTASAGSIVYSTASAMAFSSVGTVGFLLTSNGSGAPTWTSPSTFAPASHNHPYLDLSGATSITTVGTIVTGTWSATDVGLSHGGTNASLSAVAGGVVYSTSSAMAITAAGTSGYLLTSNGSGAPTWASPTAHTHTYASLTGRPSVTRDRYISSGITKTTNITIPNSRTYVVGSNSLLVFRDGLLLAKDTTSSSYDFDYWEVSTTQVRFNYNIPSNSIIEFIIIPI